MNLNNEPYIANPHFYAGKDGEVLGSFALTEGTDTVLPKAPQYAVNGELVTIWQICFVSIKKNAVIGKADYFDALSKLTAYAVAQDDATITVRGLTFRELKKLMK